MKSSIVNRIYGTPLTYPYFDIEALRLIEPLALRFDMATTGLSPENAEENGLDMDRVPEMLLAQYQAGRHIAASMNTSGISAVSASEQSGIDRTMISKYIQGKRPFTPSTALITPFCYNVLHASCHKIMFGEEGRIVLPTVYAEAAKAMAGLTDAENSALLRKAEIRMALYERQNPRDVANAPHRDVAEIIGERILELINDKGVQTYQLFGKETPYRIRNFIRQFVLDEFAHENPRLSLLMYIAFESGMALDYFIAENCLQYAPCFYREEEREVPVHDKTILRTLGICFALPQEGRSKMLGTIIGASLAKKFSAAEA